jgi:hypothetical protein
MSIPQIPPEQLQAELNKMAAKDDVSRTALSVVLPGPLADTMGIDSDIPVGRWKVRPFYDLDFEFLAQIKHPLYEAMVGAMLRKEVDVNFVPSGAPMWNLAWLLTRSPEEVESKVKEIGYAGVGTLARNEFGRLRLIDLVKIYQAVSDQMGRYWSVVQEHGPAEVADKEAPKAENPSLDQPLKASGG